MTAIKRREEHGKESSRRKNEPDGKKSRRVENQNTSIVLKLNCAELLWGGIVMDPL